jgi:hypothetical protein
MKIINFFKIKFFTYSCVVYIEGEFMSRCGAFLYFGVCNRTEKKFFSFKKENKHITIDIGPLLHAFIFRRASE